MGKALGHEQLMMVFGGQRRAIPLTEGRGIGADVDRDIEDLALQHVNQLALGMRVLEMQPAQGAPSGKRQIVLHEMAVQARLGIATQIPGFLEEPPTVAEHIGLDQQQAGKRGGFDDHAGRSIFNRRSRYSP